jgi:hypothetical protein
VVSDPAGPRAGDRHERGTLIDTLSLLCDYHAKSEIRNEILVRWMVRPYETEPWIGIRELIFSRRGE